MNFDTKSYVDFLSFFSRRKNNLLRQSNATPIKRIYVLTQDLSAQPESSQGNHTMTSTGLKLFKVPSNFTGLHVQKYYSTAGGITSSATTGQIYLAFDDSNIGNVNNSKLLQINDTFDLIDGEVANGWLWWNNQADTTVSIAFFIDMDYRAGSSTTTVAGVVTVVTDPNTPGVLQVNSTTGNPVIISNVGGSSLSIGSPTIANNGLGQANGPSGSFTFTVPANFQAEISLQCTVQPGIAAQASCSDGPTGNILCLATNAAASVQSVSSTRLIKLKAGQTVNGNTNNTGAFASISAALYPVV